MNQLKNGATVLNLQRSTKLKISLHVVLGVCHYKMFCLEPFCLSISIVCEWSYKLNIHACYSHVNYQLIKNFVVWSFPSLIYMDN